MKRKKFVYEKKNFIVNFHQRKRKISYVNCDNLKKYKCMGNFMPLFSFFTQYLKVSLVALISTSIIFVYRPGFLFYSAWPINRHGYSYFTAAGKNSADEHPNQTREFSTTMSFSYQLFFSLLSGFPG